MKLKIKLLVLIGNLVPLLVGAFTVPEVVHQIPENAKPEAYFAIVMLSLLPALLAASVGMIMNLTAAISILIDARTGPEPMPVSTRVWLGFSAILPVTFALIFIIGIFK